jgi:disulfide oxidoreductase YuzD
MTIKPLSKESKAWLEKALRRDEPLTEQDFDLLHIMKDISWYDYNEKLKEKVQKMLEKHRLYGVL